MGTIGYVMFQFVGIAVLVMIAFVIAGVTVPRKRPRADRVGEYARPDDRR